MGKCLTLAAAASLTAIFVSAPLSLSTSPSSLLPQLSQTKAQAWVTYRRARVATRRAYRRSWRAAPAFYSYPYTAPNYAYRHVYAAPAGIGWGWGWHRPHWGPVRGWHWWR